MFKPFCQDNHWIRTPDIRCAGQGTNQGHLSLNLSTQRKRALGSVETSCPPHDNKDISADWGVQIS